MEFFKQAADTNYNDKVSKSKLNKCITFVEVPKNDKNNL